MEHLLQKKLLKQITLLAQQAGHVIRSVRDEGCKTYVKADSTPVTEADYAAHKLIVHGLRQLTPDIPIISEEDSGEHCDIERSSYFWLIDPLDGTKGFARGEKDFTVNIALIKGEYPLLGAVDLPDYDRTYVGGGSLGAWRVDKNGEGKAIFVCPRRSGPVRILLSKSTSHNPELDHFLANHAPYEIERISSAVKFMIIASGEADFYPRFSPTMEWDTGAPQAVIEGAGGEIIDLSGRPFSYRKPQWRNGGFICRARQH